MSIRSTGKIATVPLSGVPTQSAKYTVTVLDTAPHMAGATDFVEYLLGSEGMAAMSKEQMTAQQPLMVSGTLPPDLQGVVSGQ